jgi:3-oxoacyl-[acyl-carrier protein] reductase
MKIDLTGRTALVTGSTRGIGRAIAESLAESGARVAVVSRDQARSAEAAAAIGNGARGFAADVSDVASIVTMVDGVEKEFGQIDILVNNAGLTRDGLLLRMRDQEFADVLEVNLVGSFRCTREALRGMLRRRWGRVVSISSVVGMLGNAGQANYAASKAGLIGLTLSVAREVAQRGITANVVAPGYIPSKLTDAMSEEAKQATLSGIPAGRLGTPEEVAAAVRFLASEEAGYITGQVLAVDGGLAMGA